MKITVEFDSLEEFQKYITAGTAASIPAKEISGSPAPEKAEEMPEKPAEKPQEAPAEEKAEDSAPFEETPKIDESYRLEVRRELAALNKLQTGNPAKALIMETGYKRLTDVPLDLLPGLMEKAKEAMGHV